MGGSNQSLFIIGALLAGQGAIPGQGTAAIPLLAFGLLLSWAALAWLDRVDPDMARPRRRHRGHVRRGLPAVQRRCSAT